MNNDTTQDDSEIGFSCEKCEGRTALRLTEVRVGPAGPFIVKTFLCWECMHRREGRHA